MALKTRQVTLPDGTVIPNVPFDMTKAEFTKKAVANGYAASLAPPEAQAAEVAQAAEEKNAVVEEEQRNYAFDTLQGNPRNVPYPSSEGKLNLGEFMTENADVPGGIGGSLLGARAGAPLGPVGVLAGTVIGGGLGTFGGKLLTDDMTGEERDYASAGIEAAKSVGIDLALLGSGAVLRPIFRALKDAGRPAQEAAKFIIEQARAGGRVGSKKSKRASQNFLSKAKEPATLLPFQTGETTGFQSLTQRLAESGMFSSKIMSDNTDRVNKAVNQVLEELTGSELVSPEAIGRTMYGVVEQGKAALSHTYGEGLRKVQDSLVKGQVRTLPVSSYMNKYVQRHEREFGTVLNDKVKKFVVDNAESFADIRNMSGSSLLDFEKKLMQDVQSLITSDNGVYNGVVDRQTAEFLDGLRKTITFSLGTVDTQAAKSYRRLNETYSTARAEILPVINKSFVDKATDGNYHALGEMLITSSNTSQLGDFMKSIDSSFNQMRIAGLTEGAPVKSAGKAKDMIRAGFLRKTFPAMGPDFETKTYRALADQFSDETQKARMKIVLGDKYKVTKQLMNVMKESSERSTSNIGSLVLRGKEYAALSGAGVGLYNSDSLILGASAAVLFGPVGLAYMATNPKVVNRLLAFGKQTFKDDNARNMAFTQAFGNAVADIIIETNEQ